MMNHKAQEDSKKREYKSPWFRIGKPGPESRGSGSIFNSQGAGEKPRQPQIRCVGVAEEIFSKFCARVRPDEVCLQCLASYTPGRV